MSPAADAAGAHQPLDSPTEHHLTGSRGRRLRILVWENPDPVGRVQIVHGYSEHIARYDHIARRLVEAGWSVFGHDQVGHGASEGRPGVLEDFDDLVADLRAVEDAGAALTGVEGPRILLGHSLGSLVTIRHLQTGGAGYAGAVLSAPWLGTTVSVPLLKRLAGKVLWRFAPDHTISNQLDPTALTRDTEMQARRLADPLAHARVSAGFFERSRSAQQAALGGGVPGEFPVLMLVPLADRVADAQVTLRWARRLRAGVTVMELPEIPHEPFNDTARNEILGSLVEWMTKLPEVPLDRASTRFRTGE